MKKETKIILEIVAVVIIVLVIVLGVKKNKEVINVEVKASALKVESQADLEKLVDQIYEGVETYPSITTMPVDLTDANSVKTFTGISSIDKIDCAVVSEPMVGAQAYSMVLVKVKDGVNANKIAEEMFEGINPRKWICVTAEKIYATSSGDIAFLVMSDNEIAKPVYENFKKLAQGIGAEYEKIGE